MIRQLWEVGFPVVLGLAVAVHLWRIDAAEGVTVPAGAVLAVLEVDPG